MKKHNVRTLSNLIKTFADNLLKDLKQAYPNSNYLKANDSSVYCNLELCPNVYIKFRKWYGDKKPYFLILYRGSQYIMEFDLSRVIFINSSQIKWILNVPTRKENLQNLLDLGYTKELQETNDVDLIYYQMNLINRNANRTKIGYKFCINEDISVVKEKFRELISYTIRTNQIKESKQIKDENDIEAIEGQLHESKFLSKKRSSTLVRKRKEYDYYRCQACKFKLKIKGQYIIECHHLYPLKGEVLTSIDDLICLCPTCHRIAHNRKKPYSIEEIKRLLKIRSRLEA